MRPGDILPVVNDGLLVPQGGIVAGPRHNVFSLAAGEIRPILFEDRTVRDPDGLSYLRSCSKLSALDVVCGGCEKPLKTENHPDEIETLRICPNCNAEWKEIR